jgi:fused signal recognition particle receptor
MPPFRFRLQRLLDVASSVRRLREAELAEAEAARAAAEADVADAAARVAAEERRHEAATQAGLSAAEFAWSQMAVAAAGRLLAEKAAAALAADRLATDRREAWLAARREEQRYERLRARAHARWRTLASAAAQAELDELAGTRRALKGGETA